MLNFIQKTFFAIFIVFVHTYNLDTGYNKTFQVPNNSDSLFGYALATHLTHDSSSISLLVGSPGFNNSLGAAFHCDSNFICKSLISDVSGLVTETTNIRWFGATVVSNHGVIMVCAPRLTKFKPYNASHEANRTEGECFYQMTSNDPFQPVPAPLMNQEDFQRRYPNQDITKLTFHRELCLTGIAAAIAPSASGAKLISSSPSCINYKDELPKSFATGVWIFDEKSKETYQRRTRDYFMYFGYAMSLGLCNCNKEKTQFLAVSVGSDHLTDFKGRIIIYDMKRMKQRSALNGTQSGEYFGASLTSTDLNGDGYDDLVVGAPFYSNYTNSEIKYETGAVYVYLQIPADLCLHQTFLSDKVKHLYGRVTSSRFGSAVAGIADTDNDGFNELAIGAPYENDGAGAVYIYQGNKHGLKNEPGQIIYGDIFKPPIRNFGSAFAFGDFDNNGFNDIVVGAPLSNVAVYLPARPVINVFVDSFSFNPAEVLVMDGKCSTSDESSNQKISNGGGMNKSLGCTAIQYCIAFSSRIASKHKVTFSLNITLDAKMKLVRGVTWHRAIFLSNRKSVLNRIVTLLPGRKTCFSQSVQLKLTNIFIRPPIVTQIRISVLPDANKPQILTPIVNASSEIAESSALKVVPSHVKSSFADLPWWVYLLCALGALIIFTIVIAVLKKVGFFNRFEPHTAANQDTSTSDKQTTISDSQEKIA